MHALRQACTVKIASTGDFKSVRKEIPPTDTCAARPASKPEADSVYRQSTFALHSAAQHTYSMPAGPHLLQPRHRVPLRVVAVLNHPGGGATMRLRGQWQLQRGGGVLCVLCPQHAGVSCGGRARSCRVGRSLQKRRGGACLCSVWRAATCTGARRCVYTGTLSPRLLIRDVSAMSAADACAASRYSDSCSAVASGPARQQVQVICDDSEALRQQESPRKKTYISPRRQRRSRAKTRTHTGGRLNCQAYPASRSPA